MLFDNIKSAGEFATALARATGKPVAPRTFRSGGKTWYSFGRLFGHTKFDTTWEYQGSTAEDRRATLDFETTWGFDDLPEDFWAAENADNQALWASVSRYCRWEPMQRTVRVSSLGVALRIARKYSRKEAKAKVTRKTVQEARVIYGASEYDVFTEYIDGYYTRRVYEVTYTWRKPVWVDGDAEEDYRLVSFDEDEIPLDEADDELTGWDEPLMAILVFTDEDRSIMARVAKARAEATCRVVQWWLTARDRAENQARLSRQTEFTRLLSRDPAKAMAWWRQQPADVRTALLAQVKAL